MKTALSDIVITIDLAHELRAAGVNQPALFGYFLDGQGNHHVYAQDENQSGLPAYTSNELLDLLPAMLEVNSEAYKANRNGWENIQIEDGDYSYAHLHTVKTGGDYISCYYFESVQIAFSKDDEGKYNNLLISGDTPQESQGKLLLKLVEEGKHLEVV